MSDSEFDPNFDYAGFAKRLAEAIFPEKITPFAERVGVPQPTLSKYLRADGAGPRLDIVAKLADGVGCTLDWLVWGRGDGPDESAGFLRIPRYDCQLAAGAGSWNEGRRKIEDIPFSRTFLRERLNKTSVKGLSVLEGRGDSMTPTIQDRALILVDEDDRRLIDGVFAFVLDGDARVKRFRKLTEGVMLISDNSSYPPETVTGTDLQKLQIIGRALLAVQPL